MSHRKNQLYIPCEDFFLQPIYSCLHCRANLAHHRDLISKSFQGSQGRAYLFNNVVNVGSLVAEERMLLTGLHYVADIYCECCSFILGWKYERAFEPNQRYKEGKFIIELANLIKDNCWDTPSGPGTRARRLACPSRALFDHLDWWNKSNDSLLSNNNKTAVSTGASVVAVGAGSASEKPVTKFQSKTTFIRELSRDFQQLFGISDRSISGGHSNTNSNNTEEGNGNNNINNGNSNDNDNKTASYSDLVVLTDEISNSTMSTSIERQGDSYMRMNSDSDNIDSLIEYTTHCLPTNLLDQKSIEIQNDSMKSYSGSTDNNSLNTSFNSSKGLLETSCSSEKKVFDCKKSSNNNTKLFSKSGTCNSVHINHLKPFSDSSLSVSNGTSSKPHSKNHGRSRHKCRSRHSSNVVNPQRVINRTKNKPNVSSIEVVLSSTASNFQASQSDQNI